MLAERRDLSGDTLLNGLIIDTVEHLIDPGCDLFHLGYSHTACCDSRSADANPACNERWFIVEGHSIFVERDPRLLERQLCGFAGNALIAQIDQHDMRISAA